jgi:hypothetical protein
VQASVLRSFLAVLPTLLNLSKQMTQPTLEETNPGRLRMSALQDREMQRLSDLLAQGTLCNAREIARLLRVELGEQSDHTPKGESLRSYLGLLAEITNRY